jgi:hypothetical protein
MSKRPRTRTPEEKAKLNRWDCPGIFRIGDKVIWDGEAGPVGPHAPRRRRSSLVGGGRAGACGDSMARDRGDGAAAMKMLLEGATPK